MKTTEQRIRGGINEKFIKDGNLCIPIDNIFNLTANFYNNDVMSSPDATITITIKNAEQAREIFNIINNPSPETIKNKIAKFKEILNKNI